MEWFNVYGLLFMAAVMVPNIVFALKCKDGFANSVQNKWVETIEQIGRFGCFALMVLNIPGTCFGWWSKGAFTAYLIVDTVLVLAYCIIWAVCFRKNSLFRTLALSILPALLFVWSGIMSRSVLLVVFALLFAPSHIWISYRNAKDGCSEAAAS